MPSRSKGSILLRPILAIALPAIVTNITTPLLGICDIAIAGHRGGAAFIAALAVATSMFNMLYWLFGFLRMGSSGLTARAYGAADRRTQALVMWRGLALALAAGLIIVGLQRPLARLVLWAMDIDSSTSEYAKRYFSITVWGAPAMLSMYAMTGWLLGMQNSKVSMWVSLLTDIVNILVSVTLVFGFGMDIEGVALGTLSAQWIAAGVTLTVCLRRFKPMKVRLKELLLGGGLRGFFSVNTDIFLRTLCLVAVTMWFTRAGAVQGEKMLAVNALLMQLFTLFSYFMDGFAFSGEALAGRFLGEKNTPMLRLTVRSELSIAGVMALIFTAIYFLAGDEILGLLTDDLSVKAAAHDYLPWAVTVPLAGFAAFSCDGLMIGLTATRKMLWSMVAAMVVFFAVYALLFGRLGNHGLWIAFIAYLLVRGVVLLTVLHNMSNENCYVTDGHS